MRNTMKLILVGALLAVGAPESRAQNTVLKVVQELRFKLTGYYQMSPTENSSTFFRNSGKVTISNNDIINLLEAEVNIIFSSDAKLLLISEIPPGATPIPLDPTPTVVVRDWYQGEKFDTDVTEYFSAKVLTSIEDTKINKNPLKANGTSYDVLTFEMNVTQASFKLHGFAKMQVSTGTYEHDPQTIIHTGKVDTTGSGDYQVSVIGGVVPVALTGTIQISGHDVKAFEE
jgi:hypothetical protein